MIDMPQYQAQQKFQSAQDTARVQRAVELGGMSGVNPLTGQPTIQANKLDEQSQRWDALNQLKEMQLGNQLTIAGANLQQKEEALASRERMMQDQFAFKRGQATANNWLKDWRSGARPLTPEGRQLIQDTLGYDMTGVPDQINPMLHFPTVDAAGNWHLIPIPKSSTQQVTVPGVGKPSAPSTLGVLSEKDLETMAESETQRRMGARPTEKDRTRASLLGKGDPVAEYQKNFETTKAQVKERLRSELGGRAPAAPAPGGAGDGYTYQRNRTTGERRRRNNATGQIQMLQPDGTWK